MRLSKAKASMRDMLRFLPSRVGFYIVVGAVGLLFSQAWYVWIWVPLNIIFDLGQAILLKRLLVARPKTLRRWGLAAFLASTTATNCVYSYLALVGWFEVGEIGRIGFFVMLAGSIQYGVVHLSTWRPNLFAGLAPLLICLIGAPLIDLWRDPTV